MMAYQRFWSLSLSLSLSLHDLHVHVWYKKLSGWLGYEEVQLTLWKVHNISLLFPYFFVLLPYGFSTKRSLKDNGAWQWSSLKSEDFVVFHTTSYVLINANV